ncbi:MAG: DUF373 family protein [Candidatus Bathyarchaeota archaeon]|nr:DUF373 family protein [Candidatus Bathyarchaeota archaeon]
MTAKDTVAELQKRILILCVDRDGDLGIKAGIKTPLIGRTANLDAAVSFALSDPEEPDANAMFEAVRLYDRLVAEKKPEEIFEVATICGTELGGVGADRKLVAELGIILEAFAADEVILVSDGFTDEAVLPLVESRVPVSSVRRIVIKHSESIEETAALFTRYMKLVVENPKYSRLALGIPGLLLFVWGILTYFNLVSFYAIAMILVLGGILLVKGFGFDKTAKDFYRWTKEYSPPAIQVQIANYATIAGVLCLAISAYSGYAHVLDKVSPLPVDLSGWLAELPVVTGYFLKGSMDLIVVGLSTILIGRGVRMYFDHDTRVLRNAVLIVSIVWSRMIFNGAADVLISPSTGYTNLIYFIIVGILIAIASVLVVLIIHRSSKDYFEQTKTEVDEFGAKT